MTVSEAGSATEGTSIKLGGSLPLSSHTISESGDDRNGVYTEEIREVQDLSDLSAGDVTALQ